MKLDRETVHQLKNNGMTFEAIGKMFGVKRQRIWSIYSGYDIIYKKTEKYRMYQRHQFHGLKTNHYKPCDYCVNIKNVNTVALA